MGEYEPNDSRNVTGQAATPDGHWTGQAANDPTLRDHGRDQQAQAQQQGGQASQQGFAEPILQQQSGQSVGQSGEGVSNAANQDNDHTSAIGQPQQFDASGRQQGGQQGGSSGASRFADQVQKHQEVVDAQGNHLGTVDHLDGDRIKLTRSDSPDREHHYVALSDVADIEGGKVRLN